MTSETLQSFKTQLGNDFGEIYFIAYREYVGIRETWRQYKNLFDSAGPERTDLMNSEGGSFFFQVQCRFLEAVVLGLCRLHENGKIKVSGSDVLTIARLDKFIRNSTIDETKKINYFTLSSDFGIKAKKLVKKRNSVIAHNNLSWQTSNRVIPHDRKLVTEIDFALKSLFEVFKFVEFAFFGSISSDDFLFELNNEIVMLRALYRGHEAREIQENRDDFENSPRLPEWLNLQS